MKKRTVTRQLGKGGKYPGILRKEKRSWSSSDSDIEKNLRNHFDTVKPNTADVINEYENHALAVIEVEGYEIKKPYSFSDSYEHDNGWATLPGLIKVTLSSDDWDLTVVGRAAQILTQCHQLRSSMDGDHLENTAHHAMLLQQEVDHLNFMQWELPARVGEYVIQERREAAAESARLRKEDQKQRNDEILELHKNGMPTAVIARRYSIGQRAIQKIIKKPS